MGKWENGLDAIDKGKTIDSIEMPLGYYIMHEPRTTKIAFSVGAQTKAKLEEIVKAEQAKCNNKKINKNVVANYILEDYIAKYFKTTPPPTIEEMYSNKK